MAKRGRLLSGIQPTGRLHLGNLMGAVLNWVRLQEEYESYFMVADLHALTTGYDETGNLKSDIRDLLIDLISAGLDPARCTLFKQSDVPEHAELHLILSMITPISWLERVPSYKDKIEELKDKDLYTYGFLGYPVLQAADILIYKAAAVPVGKDQLPHLELTREIARRFNYFYGEVFPLPEELLSSFPVLPGTDGRKMSKSYRNIIPISDPPAEVAEKISMMITDPARIKREDKGHPDVCTVFSYHKIFTPEEVADIERQCREALIGCVDCKKKLAEHVLKFLKDIHRRREDLLRHPEVVDKIAVEGASRAREVARLTLEEAKRAMNLI